MTDEYDEIFEFEFVYSIDFNRHLHKRHWIVFECSKCKNLDFKKSNYCKKCGHDIFKKKRTVKICNYCERVLKYSEDYCPICGIEANLPFNDKNEKWLKKMDPKRIRH